MKGLNEYIKKHGKHFTEELAYDAALSKRWNRKQIEDAIQRKVWYNVTGSTIGDIIYLVNECYDDENFMGYGKKDKCLSYTLAFVGDYRNYEGKLFNDWLKEGIQFTSFRKHFDFTPYI
jgi:hypothetical protein